MIFVECMIMDLINGGCRARWTKEFDSQGDFNSWYAVSKQDPDFVMNIMRYNPEELILQKQLYDAKLISVTRSLDNAH